MSVMLQNRNIVQVGESYGLQENTDLSVEMVESREIRVNVVGCEVIGLIPAEALFKRYDYYLQLEDFQMSQILENKLLEEGNEKDS